jgi:hypothetical protein
MQVGILGHDFIAGDALSSIAHLDLHRQEEHLIAIINIQSPDISTSYISARFPSPSITLT